MSSDRDEVGKGIAGGGTTGTRQREVVSGVDRAAGSGQFGRDALDDTELMEREQRRHGEAGDGSSGDSGAERAALSGGDSSVDAATGERERTPASTGMQASRSGRATGEGNAAADGAPDAGSPGGMGGPGARGTKHGRPPGGSSPVDESRKR